jgi:hypothetical protein
MITQLQSIFFLCFDFSFEVNRYLVLFGSINTVLLIAVVAVLIESLGVVSIALAAIPLILHIDLLNYVLKFFFLDQFLLFFFSDIFNH